MKDTILFILFGLVGLALIVAGAIILIASFYTPLPPFNAIVLMTLGIIVLGVNKLQYMFVKMIKLFTEYITKVNAISQRPNLDAFHSAAPSVREIVINENTSKEDIEKIKNDFPELGTSLNSFFNEILKNIPNRNTPNDMPDGISLLTMKQLEDRLNKAVDDGEFEKAAKLRDEINSRKEKK